MVTQTKQQQKIMLLNGQSVTFSVVKTLKKAMVLFLLPTSILRLTQRHHSGDLLYMQVWRQAHVSAMQSKQTSRQICDSL